MIVGLTKTVAKIPSPDVLLLPNEGLQMAGLLKPLPRLGCPVLQQTQLVAVVHRVSL